MDFINAWLGQWEPLWLFAILAAELFVGTITTIYVVREFYYDALKDAKKPIRRTRKNKVVVSIVDGQATITEQPRDVEVVIENKAA